MSKKKLFVLKFLIITSPFLVLLSIYIVTDPFKVIYSYHFDNYLNFQPWTINRELVDLENLNYRLTKSDTPDSYILGNSRSWCYHTDMWESFLKDSSKPFHFDTYGESLLGVCGKVKYLDRRNVKIKNALLICDDELLSKTEKEYDLVHIKRPEISGESNFIYHSSYLKIYFTNFFFLKQLDFIFSRKLKNYMRDIFFFEPGDIKAESYSNDYIFQKSDSILKINSAGYYLSRKSEFYERPKKQVTSEPVIHEKQIVMLKEMKRIFDKDNTRLKIVISPVYDQKKINEADIKILKDIFGYNAIYDYSGKNAITDSIGNYYETIHYRPSAAQKILTDIYSK